MTWSLESELCTAAEGATTLEDALRRLGVLGGEELLTGYQVLADWRRGGAETHIYRFAVFVEAGSRDLVLKAITPDPGAISVEMTLAALVERRAILSAHGIATPTLFYHGRGVILERWIPESLADAVDIAAGNRLQNLLAQVASYAAVLDRLGFAPIEPFEALRVEHESVYAIDLGQDLGPPGVTSDGHVVERALPSWLTTQKSLGEHDIAATLALARRYRDLSLDAIH